MSNSLAATLAQIAEVADQVGKVHYGIVGIAETLAGRQKVNADLLAASRRLGSIRFQLLELVERLPADRWKASVEDEELAQQVRSVLDRVLALMTPTLALLESAYEGTFVETP